MADSDATEPDLISLQKSRAQYQSAATRIKNHLQTLLNDEDPSTLDYWSVSNPETTERRGNRTHDSIATDETDEGKQESDEEAREVFRESIRAAKTLGKRLIALRSACGYAHDVDFNLDNLEIRKAREPTKNYTLVSDPIRENIKELNRILRDFTIPRNHPLWSTAKELGDRLNAMDTREMAPHSSSSLSSTDSSRPTPKTDSEPYRMPKIDIPHFNGEIKNWHRFWVQYKEAVHDNKRLNSTTKLVFLRQAMDDPALQDLLCCETEGGDFYGEMIEVLSKRFDKPRDLHVIHCRTLADLQPVRHNKQDLNQLADTVFTAITGILRNGQENIKAVATSLVVSVLPKQLRTEWETKTETSKQVPDIFEWIEFVRQKSSNAGYEQKSTTTHPLLDQKKGSKPHYNKDSHSKQRAAVHTSAAPPPPVPTQQPTRQATHHSRSSAPRNTQHNQYRYQCSLCHEYHPLHTCSSFGDLTVPQRKEHIKANNLCWNCLKSGHNTAECRCEYRCDGKHHSMIHQDRAEPSAHPPAAALSVAASQPTAQIPSSLLMTSQVLLKGPTGKTLVVRALLDSGATFTLISTKAMKTLSLPKSKTHITIKGVQNSYVEPSHSLTNFTLSPVQEPEKTYHISAAVVPEVTCDLPLQGAATVNQLPHIRELQLADPQFHSPGRIDLVLGENILDKLLLPREVRTGPEGTSSAWNTVFRWAIRGR